MDKINYGINMQLPIYLYLINKEFKNTEVIGLYYQKLLHKKPNINDKEPLENCMFKYVLAFPSGEILSLTTDSMSGILFVDNSFIYDNIGGTVPFSSYMYKVDEESEPQPVKDLIASLGEDSRHISIAASEYIKEYCKAYVEITNISNNTTYRVDVDDLFFRGKTLVDISEDDEYSDDSRVDHIIPGKLKTEWKFVEYICGNDYHPRAVDSNNEYVKYIDNNFVAQSVGNGSFNPEDCSPTFIRSFNQFNKFSFNKINCNYSKDGYEIKSTYVFDRYSDGDPYDDEKYKRHFKIILDAIKNRYPLSINTTNRKNNVTYVVVMPEYLEYSEKDDKFRLIGSGNRYGNTINLGRIVSCKPYNKPFDVNHGRTYQSKLQTVEFELVDKRNALERVLLHFAHFEKEAVKIDEGKYLVKITYDKDDETELVIRILSFGPMIKVLSPQRFVDLIKQRLL